MNANRVAKTLVRGMVAAGLAASLAVTLQGCVLALAGAAGGGALMATDRRTVGMQAVDREIQVKAYSQIANGIPNTHVNVTVFNRVVLLTGEVQSADEKAKAEQIAHGVDNAARITNEISVEPASSFSTRTNDTYLLTRVKAELVAEKGISANDFKVVCERGTVYLMGLVTQDEGSRGADVASRVPGVMGVVKVFQYASPEEAQAVAATAATAASAPSSAQPADAEPTVGAVPDSTITAQPLGQQAPAPVTDSTQGRPGSTARSQ
jgi:osmotically-inducible protein OsmY